MTTVAMFLLMFVALISMWTSLVNLTGATGWIWTTLTPSGVLRFIVMAGFETGLAWYLALQFNSIPCKIAASMVMIFNMAGVLLGVLFVGRPFRSPSGLSALNVVMTIGTLATFWYAYVTT